MYSPAATDVQLSSQSSGYAMDDASMRAKLTVTGICCAGATASIQCCHAHEVWSRMARLTLRRESHGAVHIFTCMLVLHLDVLAVLSACKCSKLYCMEIVKYAYRS